MTCTEKNLPLNGLRNALYAEFERLNAAHFGGKLTRPEIVISTRKTYGGYYQPRAHKIVLSWQAYQEHGWDETLNTFRHEVAHIKHQNHSAAFWALAVQLGVTKRYASSPLQTKPRATPKYIYACPACGQRIARHRQIRAASSCASCDKRYNPQYALHLVSE